MRLLPRLQRLRARWRADVRGSSMITTAVTLPMLIGLLVGIYYMFWFFTIKQTLHHGVLDAANHLSDQGRYWNIDPTGQAKIGSDWVTGVDLYPGDYYDIEAKRVIINRLRDFMLPIKFITSNLFVTVTEPILAFAPDSMEAPIELGQDWKEAGICGNGTSYQDKGQYRYYQNIRFLVYASYKVPLWTVKLPFTQPFEVFEITLHDRATGYVECPRWSGQSEQLDPDKSRWLGKEGPFMPYRQTVTPGFPTVTVTPIPTITTPTTAPQPSETPP